MGGKFNARQKARGDYSKKFSKNNSRKNGGRPRMGYDELELRRKEMRGNLSYEYL